MGTISFVTAFIPLVILLCIIIYQSFRIRHLKLDNGAQRMELYRRSNADRTVTPGLPKIVYHHPEETPSAHK